MYTETCLVKKKPLEEPSILEVKVFFDAIDALNFNLISKMLEDGFPPNIVRYDNLHNAALSVTNANWSDRALKIVDLLLDYGIDINHTDSYGNSLLLYLLDYMIYWDLTEAIEDAGVSSKYELEETIRLRETFNKLMQLGPSLKLGSLWDSSIKNIFEYADIGEFLHWFLPFEENMNEKDKEIFKGYRLAALLGR